MTPHEATRLLETAFTPVESEHVPVAQAAGRVLAGPIVTSRPSPAVDVSAMDGFALRHADLSRRRLPISATAAAGRPAFALAPGTCSRVFTGAVVPAGADIVCRCEDVDVTDGVADFERVEHATVGLNIRRQGENATAGTCILDPGRPISAAAAAAIASVGRRAVPVHRSVRVSVIITGDEVLRADDHPAPEPWQVYDSNGPAVHALLASLAWVTLAPLQYVRDDRDTLKSAIETALEQCDALILTGGVSMGDLDHVPAACESAGVKRLFHKLPVRPGKPLFAGVGPASQPVMGLPGNPVSTLVSARRFVMPAVRRRAGIVAPFRPTGRMRIAHPDSKSIPLWWYRPVRRTDAASVELVPNRGSGDCLSTAASDGFVEIDPADPNADEVSYYAWEVS